MIKARLYAIRKDKYITIGLTNLLVSIAFMHWKWFRIKGLFPSFVTFVWLRHVFYLHLIPTFFSKNWKLPKILVLFTLVIAAISHFRWEGCNILYTIEVFNLIDISLKLFASFIVGYIFHRNFTVLKARSSTIFYFP